MVLQPVTAAGGVVFREADHNPEVLLIFRRGVWDLPKGKLEKEESVQECAVREVAEEIGLTSAPEVILFLTKTYHEYEEADASYGKTTHWFAMKLTHSPQQFKPQTEEDIVKVQWHSLAEAKQLVGFSNLVSVLTDFQNWFVSQNS